MKKVGVVQATEQPPRLPGYEPVRCLGRGSNGSVWLIAPDDGGPCLAAKSLTHGGGDWGERADSRDAVPRHNESQITHEWRILAQFRHDHLIPVHRIVQDSSGTPVLLMAHAAGGSLEQVVRSRGPLEVGEAVTVLTPMGQVLAFLHGKGSVHGDVSPGNVLLSSAGKPLLSDFGFGRMLGQGVEALAGTPGFYCRTDTVRDAAADVYALASVGWYALTGRPAPPTQDRLPLGTLRKDVPGELVAALEAGLAENPAHRPTAAAFAQAVFRSSAAVPVALGHAVHPSVLPELLTRKEVRGRQVAGPHRAGRRRAFRKGPRLRDGRLRRRSQRMGWLWGSGTAKARHAGAGVGRRTALVGAVAMMCVAAIVAAGFTLAATTREGIGLDVLEPGVASHGTFSTGTTSQAAASHDTSSAASTSSTSSASASTAGPRTGLPAWAASLPPVIQQGLIADSPIEALHALAWLRSYAFSATDAALLAQVNAVDSPASAADSAVMVSLRDRGHSFTGLETRIMRASQRNADKGVRGADRVIVRATVTTSAFAEQDAAGNLIHRQDKEQQQDVEMVMISEHGRWVIDEIVSAGPKK